MSILYSKIKIEIDINNDELLLQAIWEHMREIKKGGRGVKGGRGDINKKINKSPSPLPLFLLSLSHIFKLKLKLKLKKKIV